MSRVSLQLFESATVSSFGRDEVNAPLARCGVSKSDGERLVNDGLQSCAEVNRMAAVLSFGDPAL